jgi:hypothetical protein
VAGLAALASQRRTFLIVAAVGEAGQTHRELCHALAVIDTSGECMSIVRIRYRIECLFTVLSAAAFVLTLVVPDWLEAAFGVAPDSGDGTTEWGLALGLLVTTVLLFVRARHDRRALLAAP